MPRGRHVALPALLAMTAVVAIAGVGELPQGRSTLPNTFEAALDLAVRVPVFELEG